MSRVTVEWVGAEEFGRVLQKAIAKSPELVDKVIFNNAEDMKDKAFDYAPKDTGYLKSKICHKPMGKMDHEVGSYAEYAGFQEFGTRFQPGKKHLRPAFQDILKPLEKDIKDVAEGMFI